MYNFKLQITDCSVYYINKYININSVDIDYSCYDVDVDYCIEINARNYGIKSIDINIKRVTANIAWSVYNDELTDNQKDILFNAGGKLDKDMILGTINIDSNQLWTIDNEMTISKNGCIVVESVEFDLPHRIITVY